MIVSISDSDSKHIPQKDNPIHNIIYKRHLRHDMIHATIRYDKGRYDKAVFNITEEEIMKHT